MQNEPGSSSVTEPAARPTERRGIALITALFGVVVLGVMMSGMHFSSTQEYRGTRNALIEQRGFAVAEFGLNSEISNWDRSRNLLSNFAVGRIDSNQVYVAAGDTSWVKVSRLTENTFWVVSDGRANIGNNNLEARRQTSAFVRMAYPSITPKGAITAAGNVRLGGSSLVSGDDVHPSGWTTCSAAAATVPAVVIPPGQTLTYGTQNVSSVPALQYDAAASDSNTYVRYGSESWNSLTANADIKLTGGTYNSNIQPVGTATTCDKSDTWNWGDPYRPGTVAGCHGYWPIVFVNGSLIINGDGYGQGILLVNGDLKINGKFEYYGLVVVRDDVDKGNGTAKIHGALYAANATFDDPLSWINGNQDVQYSKCAVESALAGSAILVRVTQRHWAQVF